MLHEDARTGAHQVMLSSRFFPLLSVKTITHQYILETHKVNLEYQLK